MKRCNEKEKGRITFQFSSKWRDICMKCTGEAKGEVNEGVKDAPIKKKQTCDRWQRKQIERARASLFINCVSCFHLYLMQDHSVERVVDCCDNKSQIALQR